MTKPLFLILFSFAAGSLVAQSVSFEPVGWRLGTEFPRAPKVASKIGPSRGVAAEYRAYVMADGERLLAIFLTRMSASIPPEQQLSVLDFERQKLMADPHKRITVEEPVSICGRPARRFVYESTEGDPSTTELRVLIIDNDIYHFGYTRNSDRPMSPAARAFFDKIKERKQVY